MKQFFLFFLCLVLLSGCLASPESPSEPVTVPPTETEAAKETTPLTEATLPAEQPGVHSFHRHRRE